MISHSHLRGTFNDNEPADSRGDNDVLTVKIAGIDDNECRPPIYSRMRNTHTL